MPLSESSYLPPAAFVLSHVLGIAGVLYWRSRSREDERDRVQKKTFTKWVNKHLMKVRKHINDLYEDLRDGHNLISLLEVLSGVKLPPAQRSLRLVTAPAWCRASSEEEEDDDDEEPREKGRMRFHRLQNVQIALDFLKQRQVKLVNIRNDDITDGNPKLTLGLIWTIILHFQISDIYISGELGDMSAKEKLLLWTQKVTAGYIGVKCTNFSSCWSDGKMFNALIHRYRPDLVDMERVQIQSNRENLEQAFEIAERLGVTRLLDAEDVDVPSPDEKSVITYVSSIYDAFPKVPEGGEGISAIEVDSRWLEYQTRVESLISWIKQHTILMSDKSFPQNPVELKALYNQYIHFKETEIPAKEQEKGQIEELYKLLEVWIEFGRIKLPQGYHPNDVEEEWGKLIIEMLEREKLLRPAVERLELLLQIANKIQNGALSCEEKLTLAKNTLQADAAHLESGQPVQYESDVVVYLQECEGLLRQLQVDVQILRDENYYQLEELVFRIMRLQDELVTLRLECTNLYRKGHFSTLELAPTSTLSTTHLKGEPLTKGLHTSSASWFRKPMTRTELVAISSSEDEGSLRFVYELLAWVEEMQMRLERAEWGTDLPSVESQLETQRYIHASVEDLGSSVKEARMYKGKMSPNFRASYTETLGKLETQYCKLMETSSFRLRHLQSLHGFVSRATAELIWLNEKEEEELAYDWSDNNPNIAAKKNYFSELTAELEEKQDIFRSLQDTAELLSLENHPAKQTVEAYSAAVHTQWQWIKQLCLCVEQHVKENAAYFQFFSDARESETYLRNLQDSIKRKYSCDHNTSLTRLEDLLQDSMDEKEQLIQSKSSVASLVGRSKTIVQLRPRNPEHAVKSTIPIKAVCDYRQIEITICRNDECVLEDNSQRTKWKVISPTGNEAMVPSVCFLIPPPNKEAIEMANRVEQLYQKVMALWHQLHMNTKSLISWNYLRKDIALVQSFSMEKLRSLAQGECQQALKSLQAHYEDFLQDSRDSELFSVSDRLRLEEEVESSKEHIRQLLESMENEDKDETVARTYLSELKNIRLRLEECEQRLVSRIQSPSSARADGDTIQENAIRIAEQERVQEDLQQLQSELRVVSERCCSFLDKAPAGPSTPHLRSELDLVVNKMEQTHGLSSVYLEKLKTVDIIIRSTQGAESLVKGYEVKLSQEEAVPADLAAIQAHRTALQQWLGEVKDKGSVFSTLEEEMAKAKEVGEQLFRLRQERSIDLERFQEKGSQLWDRWQRVCAQIETRHTELESIQEVLSDYRQCHSALIQWIEEITAQQELMKPGQAEDSRVLSEQLSQQTALAAEIEKNQAKLDQCQKFSQQYSAAVKDYELQLMTYRAFVESQQKSPMKRRRMLSSSDAITQEFMDLRTRYTALVTLTTQHVKYISDALRRLEEEEKVVEEEKQEHVDKVKELLGWALGLKQSVQGRTAAAGSRELGDIEKSISEQQALNEELTAKKEQVSEAIKTSQIFLAKHSHKLSQPEKDQISAQIGALKETYQALCSNSTEQLQQLQSQLAQETEHKVLLLLSPVAAQTRFTPQGVEKVSFCCVSRGHWPLTTSYLHVVCWKCWILILILLLLFLFQGSEAVAGVIDLGTVEIFPVFGAMQRGLIDQDTGLVLLEAQVITSDLQVEEVRCEGRQISMETAVQERLLPPQLHSRLLAHLEGGKDLIDPNTAEKITLPELLERCIIHQETGLRLLPVKQLADGMVSVRSGREVSIFRAVQEGLIDRQVTIRLLEAHLFAGGIVDPRTGHRLTVDEAVRHNLIDQDVACTLLIRQLQTGGIIYTATGERLTVGEALRKGLVAPRIALLVLESLRSFMGLLWPETGEIIPVADALEQGVLSTELIHEILSKRQLLGAVFVPETMEVMSWQKAVEQGVLQREVVMKLKSTAIPDVMASLQLAGSPSRSRHGQSSPGRSPTGHEEPLLRSDDERLMFHLMTHSYINIHDGQKVLLVDSELNNLTKALIQSQENGSCAQALEGFEEKGADAALESQPCNGLALQQLELQFAPPKGASEKIQPPRTALENGEVVVGPESLLLEDAGDFLRVEEQEQISREQAAIRSETGAEFGREQVTSISKDKHQVKLLMPEPPSGLDSGLVRETEEMMIEAEEESKPPAEDGVEGPEDQKRALESGAVVVKSEICITMGVPESRDRLQIVAERSQGVRESEREAEDVREVCLLKEERVENGVLGGEEVVLPATGEAAPADRQSEDMEGVLEVEEGEWEEVLGDDEGVSEPSLPAPGEQEAEDALGKLLTQLQSGGIIHEQTGKTLLLDEAVASGVVSGHTAVKLMERMKMFSGFFDSQVCEPLTTEDVIEEGLMDEKLLQKVLASDKAISGVLDPGNNFVYSIKDAAAVGLLDKETAMRILEGQVVTGGIVDLKRGKKVSVTLASKLGLIEPTSQTELVKLEKASKGKGTDEVTRQKLINLQAETSGIVDPETKRPLTVAESVEKGLLEKEKALQLLTKQVADGGIIHHVSGMRLSVDDAMEHGLIRPDLCKELRKAEGVVLQDFVHPATKEKLPLPQAVSLGLVSPEFQRKVQEIQAESGSILDPASGQRLALCQAVQEGLVPQQVLEKALSSSEMREGIVDPETCMIVPYSEFLKKCKIDIESGQRYLEVHPFQAIKDEVTGTKLTCAEALRLGKVDPLPTLRLLQAQADSGGVVEGTFSKRLSLRAAVERGMLDEAMAKVIATKQLRAGGIVDAPSGKRLTVNEAVGKGLISQKLAASLRDVQISEGKVGSEVSKVEKPQLPQGKIEKLSPKEEGVILPTRSADGAEPKAQPEAVSDDTAQGSEALISCLILQIKFSKKMCLEHDQRLISYLSMLRDIEMRIKRVQPAEQNLAALHDLRQQAEALGAELQELSFPVNQELDAVQRIVANPPEEVPEQLLKALEKDAKNLQKSLSSAKEILQSRLQNLRGAEILAHHETLQGKLQELLSWVSGTTESLDDSDFQQATDANSLSCCLQHYKELKEPLANTKAELDATAFDIQFLISEHAQDLTPQQSRQLLRLLNELQKAFRELSERVTARLEVLQVCLQQAEQTDQVKTLQEQQAARAQSLAELSRWLGQAEDTLAEQQRAEGDLPALQQRQSDVKELQRNMHSRAASFTGVLKSTEQFLEENKAKLEPGELAALQQDLQRAKEQYRSLQERTEVAQKELESAVSAAVQQETEKVKAAKELEENSNKIDSLLNWVASLEQKGELPEYRPHPVSAGTGTQAGKSPGDVPDGHAVGADSAAESLDEQFERLKAQHQELLSQQQDVILATQSAQAFLDKHGHSLAGEERERLQAQLAELRDQYSASLSRSETRLKRVQLLREELQKFLRDHGEFEAWLEQAEQDLQGMYEGDGDPASLRQLLLRQRSFSEDVISHKGDLRFVTMSGQKFLEGDAADAESQLLMSRSVVKSKLEDATQRYTTLHSRCSKLGSHLNTLLDHYQQFQEVAESLRTWLQESEAALGKLLSETVSSDLAVLQKQLASTKQLQGDLAEHQVPVEKLQKAARSLLDIQGEPAPDHGHIQETTDAIVSRFQSLSQQMSERSDLLQKSIAQSQSVQESLESLLQSVAEIEKNLERDQPAVLSSASIQDSLATSVKLKQDIARQKSCLEATREMVTRFTEAADSPAASALQDKLAQVTEHFGRLCQQQQEREDALKGLLPKVEQYEQLSEKLQQFTESRTRMLASGNQPDRDIAHFSQHIQELNSEMRQHQEDLATLEHLAEELSSCGFSPSAFQQQEKLQSLKKDFLQLQKVAKDREKDASSCQEQLDEFRNLVGTVRKWLRESEGKIPPAETSLGTQELQQRRQQIQDLLEEWKGKGTQVEEIGRRGTLLENLIVEITAPNTPPKAVVLTPGWILGADLTEIQCDVSDVSRRYQALGAALRERQQQLSAMLDRMQEVQEEASSMLKWLESKERTLSELDASSSPTKTETMRAQAEHNKAFLAELEQNSGKIQKVKEALSGLLEKYPDSPEAANWKKMQEDLNCRWERASQATAARQQKLEESATQLATFQAAEAQLRPWLMEKELMMSVLGPLSIDPNMLNAQKQQVQFMLKEFEARRQQHEQLNQAAQSILTGPGDVSPSTSQVRDELQGVNQKWSELTERLNSRSSQIDQAIVKSTQYQELLQGLSEKVKAVGQRLSSQSAISTQPDAVKQQLEETSEIRSDLEQLEEEISEAQTLCDDLSILIGEQYLKDELRKRLETVALPLKGLEDLAADRMNRLQTALASSQQFQHMFDELRTWLDDKRCQQAQSQPISAKLERLQSQIQEQEEFQKSLNQHSGSYEMIVAEGESLLLSVQPGEEKTTLQNQLVSLKTHWEELSKQAADRHSKLKDCLQKAQKYQRHAEDLLPWVEDCKARMAELEVTLDPVQLEATLLRSKAMLSDVEKRRSLLEMLNSAADILIDASQTDEDDIRDEKAGINQKMDAITEELQTKTGSIEEMSQRLKEFQESFKNIEKKLEGAKHQLEIYDALGPQACSNKNLEKLKTQQEVLQALEPQVDYLKNLTQGLVEDAPDGSDCSQLLSQADVAQQDFKAVKQKVNDCCALMENKLEGIGQFNSRVREMFSQLADLDDELDSMGPIGRDSDSLQSQAEDVRAFLGKLHQLRSDIESSESECKKMLEDEGSPDLLGLKRELETLSKQCSKLTERGRNRQEQVETTLSRVEDFYSRLKELSHMTTAAEENEALQWVVGTEVETINQQLADFKQFQKEQVDPLQLKLQQVNGVGQGLIQSAGKNCDVQGLEHDMEEINTRWNTLNKKVAQRVAQLQEALLHCGKFQDALEPLLSWLADTEELISNQKPPSAEYKVVKAQIQEQKLLQRLLDDRKATVEMIQAEGDRIAQSAEPADRDKIVGQLESLARRWEGLLGRAAARQKQLEDILVLAKQFHETTEPVSDWLSVTEKKLANSEPIGTQTAKIQQQISRHKALEEEIESHVADVSRALGVGQSLSSLSCAAEQRLLAEKLEALQSRYGEVRERCGRKAALLDQALANARLFGEEEVEVLNWLAEVEDKLGSVSIKDYKRDVLQKQHADQLALNEEIVNRKKNVDQAIRNGQALLKQTTGEEVLLIQEKLDGIKTRYSDITAASSKALRTLEQARQLATKFQSTHEELTGWMSKVEDELASSGAQSPAGEQIPQFQQRQKELKKEVMEHRLVLDTVNEVSRALLELVPWRAREGLDKLVSDTNERYKVVSDTIKQRVEEIDAAIQRSQQYEQAADAELAWVAETKRKLMALGPIRLEQDQTTAQLQVQKVCVHSSLPEGLGGEKTESLVQQYEAVSQLNSERYARLERAQVLVNQFWETYEELNPWIEETQALISQLPPPAIDHEQLKQQQDDMRQLRESIAEHKPHIDKLLKIGPQLKDLNPEEGEMVQEKYSRAEATYAKIKEEVCQRALALDEAFSQSTQFHDKIEPMLETLESLSSRLRLPPLIPAEVDKIRECISENKNSTVELEKLQPSFEALKRRGEELIGRSQGADKDLAAKVIQDKLDQMVFFWEDIKARTEEREMKFLDVLELAEKFWYDMAALLTTIKDTQDIVHDLESPGIDPSIIKQQVEAAETIKEETDGLHEELEFIRLLGTDLIFACGETEKPEVKKSIDEMNNAWENLNKMWKERLEKLEEAMQSAVQYQDTLQAMFDWLDNAVIKLCNMSPVGTDLSTVKEQMNEMKEFKMEVYQQQIEMEKLNHQGELMLKKATDETDRDIIKEPLTELKHLWENLGEKIAHRQHKLEAALLALGQFQHALAELMAWLTHTEELLDAQKPINGDPKVIEVELAKHHVLKNDVLAHQATVETVNKAGNELLESSAGDDASSLRNRLEKLNSCWELVLQKTEEREQQLQSTLQQAQGFHGEIEDFLLWLTRMESQLSASKPTGGLPETAREQLNAHMELYSQFKAKEDVYSQLLAKGRLMLLNRDDSGSGSKTEQSVALLEQKWSLVSTKMEERKAKLEEALALATDFQNSLQDFINWLTLAEQSLNVAPPPSLILAAVLAQIDEHKVFANEVNAHRDRIIELDQTGNQLKFLSQKQDVVLIKNLLVSVQSRWEKVVQRSVERGRALDDARKRAKQFHEAWKKLIDWLEDAENHLDSELEISNDPDKIKLQLSKHKEFQKTLGGKQPVYDTTIRTGRALKEKALLPDDTQKLDNLLGEVRDKWDTVCGKSVERQHKLEEALLFSGQFMDALQALVDWLYKVEPQLAEDQPVHGDLDLVMNLMDAHKVFQKELGKRTGTVQVLKRSGRELIENSRDDTTWVKVQLQELSNRWDTVCKLSVSKQTRLEQALKQAEEFRTAVHMLLEWLSEAEQSLRFRGALPDDAEALQVLIDTHKEFMKKVEEKRVDMNAAVAMGEVILGACHPDCITTIKHWITIIRARFEEVLTWAKQHQQRLESALSELVANAELLEELLAWIQWAETTLIQRDQDPVPQNIDQVKALISEHQSFMEEMTRKQPDVDRVTKTYKRKATEPPHGPFIDKSRSNRKSLGQAAPPSMPIISQSETKNPRINQLSARWQQVWLLALERQRKLNDALDRLEELKEFANFDFDVWRKKYMRWMNHKKSRVMDFFRRIDKDQDGKITRQEFIDGILASKFPTTKLEMTAVADIFDRDGDGYIDYYEFVAALHPNKDAYRPTTDADKIEDEVTRQVAQCKCAKRFQVEQIGENKYRFFLGNQFGDSQQLRLVRILRSTVMVRVGGGWMALDEFLVKNDPCRGKKTDPKRTRNLESQARGRTNLELREKFILPEGASQGMTPFRSRGRRSKPSSRAASPTRSSSSASQSNHSCASMPSSPATPASGAKTPHHFSRCYDKPWLINSKASTPLRGFDYSDFQLPSAEVTPSAGSKLKRPTFHSSRTSLAGDTSNSSSPVSTGAKTTRADPKKAASRPTSRAGSRTGSRASSRRGSDASDFDLLETQSACSDTSESSVAGGQSSRRGVAKPSKIPTMSKKTPTATPKTPGPKR
uniref:Microtubule actin crosslinking factor 1 n=1 Tax=Corvus moneduloides TaxID=1196302 RepID=A0A8C3H3M0_CORMO